MKKIVFRADDLGYSEGVNYGIAKTVHEGLICNVGIMTNTDAVRHGLEILKGAEICLGLHTNISSGKPIVEPLKVSSLVDEKGRFKTSKIYNTSNKDFVVLEEVMLEIEAQYHRFIELVGRKPDYFEGHAVKSETFFKAMQIFAKKHGLKYSPFPKQLDEPVCIGNHNVFVHAGSTSEKNPEQCLQEIIDCKQDDSIHLMVYHPGYVDAYLMLHSSLVFLRPFETEMLCNPKYKELLENSNCQCITYDDL